MATFKCQFIPDKKGHGKYRIRHAFNFPEIEILQVP